MPVCNSSYINDARDAEGVSLMLRGQFDPLNLKSLHIEFKHGSLTDMRNWLAAPKKWKAEFEEGMKELMQDCTCGDDLHPKPHPKVSTTPPLRTPQEEVALDVV